MDRRSNRPRRRHSDRRAGDERRRYSALSNSWNFNSWRDQRLQYQVRFLLALLALLLFNFVFAEPPRHLTLVGFNLSLLGYLLLTTVSLLYARTHPGNDLSIHVGLWIDLLMIALVVVNDPEPIPLTALTWIIVVIGNGMRYGMLLFRIGLIGSLAIALPVLLYLAGKAGTPHSSSILLMTFLQGIILVYAYLLLHRIEQSHMQIQESSRLDPLTGLLNRSALLDSSRRMLDEARQQQQKLVVMFIDIDRFKQVNDTHGHLCGDRLLANIAKMLNATIRETDLAARYGGDEFVLILTETDASNAALVAQRLQKRIERWARQNHYDISLSIGIGEAPTHGVEFEPLLHKVDQAMYETKLAQRSGGIAFVSR